MKRYVMSMGAGLAGLRMQDVPRPTPEPGQVLVRVHAVSLNYREVSILMHGSYPLPVKPEVVAMADGAGEVVEVGSAVDRVRPGDRVMANVFPRWLEGPFRMEVIDQLGGSLDGMFSEYVCLPQEALVTVPAHLSYEEAATLPCAGLTAWHAVTAAGSFGEGETVLTLGSGAVSLFALQFAKLMGGQVIATTSSSEKEARLLKLGADHVINYRTDPQWDANARTLTQGVGVERVIDVAGATLAQSLRAVRLGGHVAVVGMRSSTTQVDVGTIVGVGATIRPVAIGSRLQFEDMVSAIAKHDLHPVIDKVFSFDEAAQAFAYYVDGTNFGKVVIKVG